MLWRRCEKRNVRAVGPDILFTRCLDKGNPRLCRGAKRAYSDEKSKQEKVPELK